MHSAKSSKEATSAAEGGGLAPAGLPGSQASEASGGGTAERLEALIALNQRIAPFAPRIASAIARRYEPVEDLNRLNYLLDAHFEDVWEMLHTPGDLPGFLPAAEE